MKSKLWHACLAALVAALPSSGQQTGFHPEWPRWCGKVYQEGYPNFDPGGQLYPPTPSPSAPLLNIQFSPRYSLYLPSNTQAEILIRISINDYLGVPWSPSSSSPTPPTSTNFTISLLNSSSSSSSSTATTLLTSTIPLNSTSPLVYTIPLSLFPDPSFSPIPLLLSTPYLNATSSLLYLPDKSKGSITRIDNLHQSLLFRNSATNQTFVPFFPYGFYASDDRFLRITNGNLDDAKRDITRYKKLGMNAMVPLITGGFGQEKAVEVINYLESVRAEEDNGQEEDEKAGIKWMVNLRESYKNLTYVRESVELTKDREGVWGYWGFDEPDGWQDPFELPIKTKELINSLDPYHPVAVTLNCQNYHYPLYSASGDIVMTDPYPIGINSTFSKWNTPCNSTYGDCGCDNCLGTVRDVPDRLDTFSVYEGWLGTWPPKAKIHNPQSFSGDGYWSREPTPQEEDVMNLLGVNHGSVGVISWLWPASDALGAAHGRLAKVLAAEPVLGFLVRGEGPKRTSGVVVGIEGEEAGRPVDFDVDIDVAYWIDETGGKILVSVVNSGESKDSDSEKKVLEVKVPLNVTGLDEVVFGDFEWKVSSEGGGGGGGGMFTVGRLGGMKGGIAILKVG